jgi:hypothetical protein
MALFLRDGVKIVTFGVSSQVLSDEFLNPVQVQCAGALETSWIAIPLKLAWEENAASHFGLIDNLGSSGKVRGWHKSIAQTTVLWFDLHGHPSFRRGCGIIGARVKTGGSDNGGTIDLYREQIWTGAGVDPGDPAALAGFEIAEGADNVFNGTGKETTQDWSSSPGEHVIDDAYRYMVRVSVPAGHQDVFALQIQCQFPVAP